MKIRNNVYRLDQMEPGDRFYLANDKKKTVLQLHPDKPFEQVQQKQFWKHYANCLPAYNPTVGQLKHPDRHEAKTLAIFLRNTKTETV